MPLNLSAGDSFPDHSLIDDAGVSTTIGEVTQGQPLFLAFFRGPW